MVRQGHYEWRGDVAEWVWDDAPASETAEAPAEVEQAQDLESLTVAELRERAEAAGIEGFEKMRKADLVEALG